MGNRKAPTPPPPGEKPAAPPAPPRKALNTYIDSPGGFFGPSALARVIQDLEVADKARRFARRQLRNNSGGG